MENKHQSPVNAQNDFSPRPNSEYFSGHNVDDEIDIAELFKAIWQGKLIILIVTVVFAIAGYFYAKSLPDIYKASTLLTSASSKAGGGMANLAGSIGGLASIAGLNLGGETDKTGLAIEIMQSRYFIEHFINKHQLLVPLMAANGWDRVNNRLLIDEAIYDETNKKWLRQVTFPKQPVPSTWEAFEVFSKSIVIEKESSTSMISISLDFYSPKVAEQWLLWLVEDINDYMREQDEIESNSAISYLQKQLSETKIKSMENVFYQLIEEQSKTLMLTNIKEEYVLKTIDPANTPEKKDLPNRLLILILAIILGGVLSSLTVLIRYYFLIKPSLIKQGFN